MSRLRERNPEAELRYVDDDASVLQAVARDSRLLSVKLFFASWGYTAATQDWIVGSMPRVRALESSRDLQRVLEMPRKDGLSFRV